MEKPFYIVLAALAVLVVAGGIFISPYAGGPTGAQTATCGTETVSSGPMGEVRSILQTGGSASFPVCSTSACTAGFKQAGGPIAEIYFDEDGLVNRFNIQKICLKAISARTSVCESTGISSEANVCKPIYTVSSGEISIGTLSDLYKTNLENSVWNEYVYQLIVNGVSSGSIQVVEQTGSFSSSTSCPAGKLYAGSFLEIHFRDQEFYRKHNICLEPGPPGAPTNLNGVSTVGPVHLTWSAPAYDGGATIDHYNIYRKDLPSGPYVKIGQTCSWPSGCDYEHSINREQYDDSGLENGKTYYYKVSAVNKAPSGNMLEGSQSNEKSVTTLNTPSAPSIQSVYSSYDKPSNSSNVQVSWSAPNDGGSPITQYNIYRRESSQQSSVKIGQTASTSYTDTGLDIGKIYYYKISATNAVGNGQISNENYVLTPTTPSAPVQVSATSEIGKNKIKWESPNFSPNIDFGLIEIKCYKVYRIIEGSSNYILISSSDQGTKLCSQGDPITEANVNPYTDSAVSAGVKYFYKIAAVNDIGVGNFSLAAEATAPGGPTSPRSLSAVGGLKEISLSWQAPASDNGNPVLCYKIFRSAGNNTEYKNITSSADLCLAEDPAPAATSFIDKALEDKIKYYYYVKAKNAAAFSPASLETSATTLDTVPPTKVSGVNASAGSKQIILTWNASTEDDLKEYRIFRDGIKIATISNISILTYSATGLTNGKQYSFQVAAADTAGNAGEKSDAVLATPVEGAVADTTPPKIFSTIPMNATTNVEKTAKINITFSEAMNQSETEKQISILPAVSLTKVWSDNILTLVASLDYDTEYSMAVGAGAMDLSGNNLSVAHKFSFRTAASPTTATTRPSSTTTSTVSIAIGTTTTKPRGTITTFAPAGEADALSAIKEANQTIIAAQGIKNVSTALDYYSQAIISYNNADYPAAKAYALQAKDSIKEKQGTEQIPILYVSIAAIVLLIGIAGFVYFMYVKKTKAEEAQTKPQEPAQQPEQPATSVFNRKIF